MTRDTSEVTQPVDWFGNGKQFACITPNESMPNPKNIEITLIKSFSVNGLKRRLKNHVIARAYWEYYTTLFKNNSRSGQSDLHYLTQFVVVTPNESKLPFFY